MVRISTCPRSKPVRMHDVNMFFSTHFSIVVGEKVSQVYLCFVDIDLATVFIHENGTISDLIILKSCEVADISPIDVGAYVTCKW